MKFIVEIDLTPVRKQEEANNEADLKYVQDYLQIGFPAVLLSVAMYETKPIN